MGGRKALRALAQPTQDIAAAILGNDIKALTTLPEVGKKTAETIARELQDIAPSFAGNAPLALEPLLSHNPMHHGSTTPS